MASVFLVGIADVASVDAENDDHGHQDLDTMSWPNVAGAFTNLELAQRHGRELLLDELVDADEGTERKSYSFTEWKTIVHSWTKEYLHQCHAKVGDEVVGIVSIRETELF